MEKKIKLANIEQAREYQKKNGETAYKYMAHQEHWDKEKKQYNGWEHITIYSDRKHNAGSEIAYAWEQYQSGYGGKYIEVDKTEEATEEDNLPF